MNSDFLSEEERFLAAHISDLERLSARSGVPRFSAFLNEREQAVAAQAARGAEFFGGYEGAGRRLCGFFAETYAQDMPHGELFPVAAVTFTYRPRDVLSHRDFLGAILSLGLKREMTGDILTAQGYAVVFCCEGAQETIMELTKVGRVGVSAEAGVTMPLPEPNVKRIDATVSSLRLDCIVSAAADISREKAAALIKGGLVSADHVPCTSVSREVGEGAVISIRGSGRYRLKEVAGSTRKGRLRIVLEKSV